MLSLKKIIILKVLILSFTSCSLMGEWAYSRLDSYLTNYFFQYANFNRDQKSIINNIAKDFHYWHEVNEMPKYKKILESVKSLDEGVTHGEVEILYLNLFDSFKSSNNFFIPHIVTFSKSLNDSQVSQIDKHFLGIIEKRKRALKKSKTQNFKDQTLKNSIDGFKRVGIRINEKQKININEHINLMEDIRIESINAQDSWNKKLIKILILRESRDFEILLLEHLKLSGDFLDGKLKIIESKNRLLTFKLISSTLNSLDAQQKKSYKKRIDSYIRLIDRVIRNSKLLS